MTQIPTALFLSACLALAPVAALAGLDAAQRAQVKSAETWLYQDGPGSAEGTVAALVPLAQAGDPRSAMVLGFMYRYGRGVDPDLPQALRYYRIATAGGNARGAVNGAAVALELRDGATAAQLLRAAGNAPDTAHLWARGHLDGLLPGADRAEGLRLLNAAIAQGDLLAAREALRRLARGEKIDIPLQRAVTLVERAGRAGDENAAASLLQLMVRRPELVRAPSNRPNALAEVRAALRVPPGVMLEAELRALAEGRITTAKRGAMVQRLEAAPPEDYGYALTQLRWIDEAAYVRAVQSALIRRGLFEGRATGRMTPGFALNLASYCRDKNLPQGCAQSPIKGPISRAIAQELAKDHRPR